MHLFGLNCDHDYQSGLPVGYRLATVIYGWLASIRGRCLVALLSSQHTAIIFFREQLQTAIKNRLPIILQHAEHVDRKAKQQITRQVEMIREILELNLPRQALASIFLPM